MKIVSSGKAIHSPEFLRKKQRNKRIKLGFIALCIILFISTIIYLSHNDRVLIGGVKVSGANVTDGELVAKMAQEELEGSYLFVFPRANILIYPRDKIREAILREFPRLSSVALSLEGLNLLKLEIKEREPEAIYCSNKCYFIDENGFIFAEAPSFEDGIYLVFETSDTIENPIGKTLTSRENFVSLSNFARELDQLGINVSKLLIKDGEYAVILPNGGEIIWRSDADLNLIYANLEAFLSDNDIKRQEKFLERVSRIDLRTENKIFYRFKGE